MTTEALHIGDIVEICAVDWAIHEGQLPRTSNFDVVHGRLYGEVVRVTDDAITLAPQVFADGGVRCALTVPRACISQVSVYVRLPRGAQEE